MSKSVLMTGALAAMVLAAPLASADPLFVIDESVVTGAVPFVATGDKLNGSYTEKLTIHTLGNFSTQAFGDFTALVNGNSSANSQLGPVFDFTAVGDSAGPFNANNYRLFFTFDAAGGFVPPGGFVGGSGNFKLWLDTSRNTTATLVDGDTPVVRGNTGDDTLIATASTVEYGIGNVINPGAFEIVWSDFTLTAAGASYFISPDPFYVRVLVDGDFDVFQPSLGGYIPGSTQTFDVRGDVSAVFMVPEPTALSLVGLALVGAGFASRRRSKA